MLFTELYAKLWWIELLSYVLGGGSPSHESALELMKYEAQLLQPASNIFWINGIKRFQTGYFLKNLVIRPTKIATFLAYKN